MNQYQAGVPQNSPQPNGQPMQGAASGAPSGAQPGAPPMGGAQPGAPPMGGAQGGAPQMGGAQVGAPMNGAPMNGAPMAGGAQQQYPAGGAAQPLLGQPQPGYPAGQPAPQGGVTLSFDKKQAMVVGLLFLSLLLQFIFLVITAAGEGWMCGKNIKDEWECGDISLAQYTTKKYGEKDVRSAASVLLAFLIIQILLIVVSMALSILPLFAFKNSKMPLLINLGLSVAILVFNIILIALAFGHLGKELMKPYTGEAKKFVKLGYLPYMIIPAILFSVANLGFLGFTFIKQRKGGPQPMKPM